MDGSKIIKKIVFAGIIMLVSMACKMQNSGHVPLFVNNSNSVDNIIFDELGVVVQDTILTNLNYPNRIKEQDLDIILYPEKDLFKTSFDSIYQIEVKTLYNGDFDSCKSALHVIIYPKNQQINLSDTSFSGEEIYKVEMKGENILINPEMNSEKSVKELIASQNAASFYIFPDTLRSLKIKMLNWD